ncbi:uncharacterized protein LOC141928918 [Strix aluco]|uniref:uncharacterized protein LOC141928918 n=1 Tax=Strix aluco TaxID=111821 RepID=UPI003DA3F74E
MKTVVGRNTRRMVKKVQSVLLPLFFRMNDQNESVAKASWGTFCACTDFLGWRRLSTLAVTGQTHLMRECLITHNRSRVVEYLHQSLPYLKDPQATVREEAVRFIGLAARHMRNLSQERLWEICNALQPLENDAEPSVSSLAAQTILILTSLQQKPRDVAMLITSQAVPADVWLAHPTRELYPHPNMLPIPAAVAAAAAAERSGRSRAALSVRAAANRPPLPGRSCVPAPRRDTLPCRPHSPGPGRGQRGNCPLHAWHPPRERSAAPSCPPPAPAVSGPPVGTPGRREPRPAPAREQPLWDTSHLNVHRLTEFGTDPNLLLTAGLASNSRRMFTDGKERAEMEPRGDIPQHSAAQTLTDTGFLKTSPFIGYLLRVDPSCAPSRRSITAVSGCRGCAGSGDPAGVQLITPRGRGGGTAHSPSGAPRSGGEGRGGAAGAAASGVPREGQPRLPPVLVLGGTPGATGSTGRNWEGAGVLGGDWRVLGGSWAY